MVLLLLMSAIAQAEIPSRCLDHLPSFAFHSEPSEMYSCRTTAGEVCISSHSSIPTRYFSNNGKCKFEVEIKESARTSSEWKMEIDAYGCPTVYVTYLGQDHLKSTFYPTTHELASQSSVLMSTGSPQSEHETYERVQCDAVSTLEPMLKQSCGQLVFKDHKPAVIRGYDSNHGLQVKKVRKGNPVETVTEAQIHQLKTIDLVVLKQTIAATSKIASIDQVKKLSQSWSCFNRTTEGAIVFEDSRLLYQFESVEPKQIAGQQLIGFLSQGSHIYNIVQDSERGTATAELNSFGTYRLKSIRLVSEELARKNLGIQTPFIQILDSKICFPYQ